MNFSVFNRDDIIKKLQTEVYDVLVIGGGITGAGIALDACLRGLKTALLEKDDFASGTSSRSTKLIHGGLRYLKQLEFGLVKEVGSERAIVHKLAPHLVIPEKMLLPLNEGRGFGSVLTSFGLMLYDWLAGVRPEDQRKMLTRNQTLKAEPLLKPDDIKGSGLYVEYRTDDARLTLEIIKTAAQAGADILNYAEVSEFEYTQGKISGIKFNDLITGNNFLIPGTAVVNATGPWVDVVRDKDNSRQGKQIHHTKGVHIVVSHQKFPIKQAVYFDVPDGRMVFAIPRDKVTYVGTTDTDYNEDLENVSATHEDALYLVHAVNGMFPTVNLDVRDIESSWAGLRPLIHEEGKSASELSRKDEIFISDSGLISIAGGKLTGYRKMAERVVDLLIKRWFKDANLRDCHTDQVKLFGSDFKSSHDVMIYTHEVVDQLKLFAFDHDQYATYLVSTYGKQTDQIIARLKETNDRTLAGLTLAELWFCIHYEMVVEPLDFFNRRTGMLYFDIGRMKQMVEPVLTSLKIYFNWTDEKIDKERIKLYESIKQASLSFNVNT
jgi:glycerol-3-phosphate dehydrogenase